VVNHQRIDDHHDLPAVTNTRLAAILESLLALGRPLDREDIERFLRRPEMASIEAIRSDYRTIEALARAGILATGRGCVVVAGGRYVWASVAEIGELEPDRINQTAYNRNRIPEYRMKTIRHAPFVIVMAMSLAAYLLLCAATDAAVWMAGWSSDADRRLDAGRPDLINHIERMSDQ
jgi:hypothetical protein